MWVVIVAYIKYLKIYVIFFNQYYHLNFMQVKKTLANAVAPAFANVSTPAFAPLIRMSFAVLDAHCCEGTKSLAFAFSSLHCIFIVPLSTLEQTFNYI